MPAGEPTIRTLHASAVARKDPPLKGPVPTDNKAEKEEGGDGFLGVGLHTDLYRSSRGVVMYYQSAVSRDTARKLTSHLGSILRLESREARGTDQHLERLALKDRGTREVCSREGHP